MHCKDKLIFDSYRVRINFNRGTFVYIEKLIKSKFMKHFILNCGTFALAGRLIASNIVDEESPDTKAQYNG